MEPKTSKSNFWVLFFKCFHYYKLLIFHVYPLHALINGLKFFGNQKIWKIGEFYIPNKMAPLNL